MASNNLDFNIRDTGKKSVDSTAQDENSGSDGIVASGAWLNIPIKSITINISPSLDESHNVGNFVDSDVDNKFALSRVSKLSVSNPKIIISGAINCQDSDDLKYYSYLINLCKTKGYKEIKDWTSSAPSETSTIYNGFPPILQWYNSSDANWGTINADPIKVLLGNLTITRNADNPTLLTWNIECTETV